MSGVIFQFPGQSSRSTDFIQKLGSLSGKSGHNVRMVLDQASDALGLDLGAHFSAEGVGIRYACNRDIQVGVFLANHLFMTALESLTSVRPRYSLGLSLGEYNHLVQAGVFLFEDALKLVASRGELYDQGPAGVMVSVSPLSEPELQVVLDEFEKIWGGPRVWITNDNSPTQCVIGGRSEDVEQVVSRLEGEFYVQCTWIEKKIPMHCELFKPVSQRFAASLQATPMKIPLRGVSYFPNILGHPMIDVTCDQIQKSLLAHVHRPVLWRQSIDWICDRDSRFPLFVEVGPKAVLSHLLGKKWRPFSKIALDCQDPADFEAHLNRQCEVIAMQQERPL